MKMPKEINVNKMTNIEVKITGAKRLGFRVKAIAFLLKILGCSVSVECQATKTNTTK